jgi:protein-S-isoprenylcysteine O-methyltransferase Ste14
MHLNLSLEQRRRLDLVEQVVVVALYVALAFRLWPGELTANNWQPLLILPSEGLAIALLLIRRPTDQISTSLWDWSVAAIGTVAVLLIAPSEGQAPLFGLLGPYLLIAGLFIHVGAKLSLWRSFGLVAANRGVRSNGLYRVVRHPMYAGYMITHIGFLLAAPSLWNVAVYAVAWTALVARIYAEERILQQDVGYQAYSGAVRYRLLPGVF